MLETKERGRYTVTVERLDDDYQEAPWDREDGHAPVSGWERRKKRPGEMVLAEDRGACLFYDYQEAIKIALRDGWDSPPYKTGTKRERAARAVEADFQRMRRFAAGLWGYVGVRVTVQDRNGEEIGEDSLWGIESDADEYLSEVEEELTDNIIREHEKARSKQWRNALHEARERRYWECRDVATA